MSFVPLKYRTLENDIKYKGFLSYRHMRILAWLFLAMGQVGILLTFAGRINADAAKALGFWPNFFEWFQPLPLIFFLVANFALILQKKDNYLILLGVYGGLSAVMYLIATIVTFHYGYGLIYSFDKEFSAISFSNAIGSLLTKIGSVAYIFNIFIDLFLCSLMFFFLNYTPKKVFIGKKLIIFRLFILFPIFYEIASIVLKILGNTNVIIIPSYIFFLLTSKPPILFIVFLVLILGMKQREKQYRKRFKDEKEYSEHEKTNAHAFRVSISLAVLFIVGAVIDVIIFFITMMIHGIVTDLTNSNPETALDSMAFATSLGFGTTSPLLFVSPILLLFNYKKTHKDHRIDILIPFAGIGLVIFVYLEGLYQVITLNLPYLIKKLQEIFDGGGGGGGSEVPSESGGSESISQVQSAIRIIRGLIHL